MTKVIADTRGGLHCDICDCGREVRYVAISMRVGGGMGAAGFFEVC